MKLETGNLSQCDKVVDDQLKTGNQQHLTIFQVTMVIDLGEEAEKSTGPAKLTEEVMGIMCRGEG